MILQTLTLLRNINKALFISLVLFCCGLQMQAQTMTEDEIMAKLNEASALDNAKKTAEALDAFLLIGKNMEQQRTEVEHQIYVYCQAKACMCYETLNRYEEAYLLAKKLITGNLTEKEKKDVGHLYAVNGYLYASSFMHGNNRQSVKARTILEEIMPYTDGKVKEYALPKISESWFFEGAEYHLSQQYDKALTCYQNALKGYQKLGKTKDEISVLQHIAEIKGTLYDVAGSENAYKQALVLAKQIGKTDVLMEILKELWNLGNRIGNVQQAQTYAASIDSLVDVTADLQTKYTYYNQKGNEAKELGQYGIAEQWYLRGKNLAERTDINTVAANKHLSYSNLRNLYAAMGRYDDAIQYAKKAIEEFQAHTPKDDVTYNLPYMALADIYSLASNKENCYRSLDKLFETSSRMTEPKELFSLYATRGRCSFAFKDYKSALNDYKKADELLAAKYPQTDGDRIALLALMGGVEHQLGNYANSEHYYRKYAEYTKALYGENSLKHINAQIYLANAEGFVGNVTNGCYNYAAAEQQLKVLMKQRIPYMSSTEREGLWESLSSLFTMMTPYALEAKQLQTAFTKNCYDALVMSKSFLLESERSMYDVIKRNGTAEDMHDYTMLACMKNQVKVWEKDYKANANSILSVSRKVSRLENLLASRCKGYSDGTDFMDVDYDAVKQALGPNEVLIDFTDYISQTQGRKYAAYIINKVQDYPLLKALFAERQIDSLGIVRPDMYYSEDYSEDVLKLLWEPLKENVSEGATIYYVPSQLLFQISLESLPMPDGLLLGNHYHFVRLSSARELVKMKSNDCGNKENTAVLYGGLQYDMETTVMTEESKKYDLSNLLAMRGEIARGDSIFHELQGTKEEILKIENVLKRNKWKVTSYMGSNGTEESFLNLHGRSPRLLHLATHGFYYSPSKAENVDYLKGYTDAMSLSGLVLSGGNTAWLGKQLPKGVLGGILTANDIARLDLSNTDMAILSACQTGQGKATAEGLYGLQRAFKKAGVGTIVLSLWSVSDKTTSEFMTTFYERLADKNNAWNKRKAFEEAKEIIRKKHPDPYLWAAFVMLD